MLSTRNTASPRRCCTAAATLRTADGSVAVHVTVLESRDGQPPRVRLTTRGGAPHLVALSSDPGDGAVVEIEISDIP